MDERLLRQAACHGLECVRQVLELEAVLTDVARTLQEALRADPSDFALAPPPHPDTHPHALPPP